ATCTRPPARAYAGTGIRALAAAPRSRSARRLRACPGRLGCSRRLGVQQALQDCHSELPTDDRRDPQCALAVPWELVDPREQQAMDRVRDLDGRNALGRDPAVAFLHD